jgi:diketogulonate reductase-like aldo/keto reductase
MTQANGGPAVTLAGDVQMPLLGFGTWQITGRDASEAVRQALAVGYRHIDTATMYRNETEVGRALRDSGLDRRDVFITTKLPAGRAGQERQTIAASLRALGTDHVDLWLIHWPPDGEARPQTWREFIAVRDEGLVRSIGVSNYSTAQIDELIEATGEAPAVNQIRWGPALYDAKRLAEHRERGVVLEGYSPFKTTNLRAKVLGEIASTHGVTPAQVVLRWHIEHGTVVIPKSSTPARIAANYDVFGFSLDAGEVARIDALTTG